MPAEFFEKKNKKHINVTDIEDNVPSESGKRKKKSKFKRKGKTMSETETEPSSASEPEFDIEIVKTYTTEQDEETDFQQGFTDLCKLVKEEQLKNKAIEEQTKAILNPIKISPVVEPVIQKIDKPKIDYPTAVVQTQPSVTKIIESEKVIELTTEKKKSILNMRK